MGVHRPPRKITICLAALSLLLLLLVCYGNSFQASWQYDDYPNIIHNERVHMTRVNGEQLMSALNAGPIEQVIARPLAYLTFALNYRFGELNVLGYHVVNFAIHWLAAFFLFLWIRGTLTLPVFQNRYDSKATLVAWLAAVFWACHPIQVTAVTYIVQRMTVMAGLFYVMAMYVYMVGRRAQEVRTRRIAFCFCVMSTVGALLSKENAVLLIYAILLYDLFFFQKMDARSIRRTLLAGLGLTLIMGLLSLLYMDPQALFRHYDNRPFTMVERLLTQPRILFFYFSLIALPMTMRLSMLHDVAISHSLFEPWTTFPAVIGLACGLVLLCRLAFRHRLFAFCGLFFLLNHAVESSFLNLELVYEHRNFVPSMLLFLPLSVAAVRSLNFFYYRRRLQYTIVSALAIWLVAAMHTTWGYNRLFRTEYSLWHHTMTLYPLLSLPYVNIGKLFWQSGDQEGSYRLNLKAVELDNFNSLHQKGIAYYNLGIYASSVQKDLSGALEYFEQARRFYEINPKIWHELAVTRIQMGEFEKAADLIDQGLARWPNHPDLLGPKALTSLKTGRYQEAVAVADRLLDIGSAQGKIAMMVLAESHRFLGDEETALHFWKELLRKDAGNMAALMALIEINQRNGRLDESNGYACRLLKSKGAGHLLGPAFHELGNSNMMPYLPDLPLIREVLRKQEVGAKACPQG